MKEKLRTVVNYKGYQYITAEDESWRDNLQEVLDAIRDQLGFERGHLKLVGSKQDLPYGTPEYGYDIVGYLKSDVPLNKEEYGDPPYEFRASISPDGELMPPVNIVGQ
jgi:hypothetical protein